MSFEATSVEPRGQGLKARAARRPVALKAYIFGSGGAMTEAEMTDLSYDGCAVACSASLAVGEQVNLSVLGRGAILAHVRWSRPGQAGLCFAPCETSPQKVAERSAERVLTEALVTARRHGGPSFRVRVHDASREGCRVDDVERFRPGEPVWIRFPGLEPLEARMRWQDEFTAGLHFLHPIHPAVFDLLAARLSGPSR